MRLELSRRAQADLDEVRDYSVAEFGAARAIAYLDSIEAAFRRMLDFPDIGPVHPGLRPPTRSLGCQQHRIFYEVDGETVRVLRILHTAMDAERHLSG
jgi:toxin ParE1/3/4